MWLLLWFLVYMFIGFIRFEIHGFCCQFFLREIAVSLGDRVKVFQSSWNRILGCIFLKFLLIRCILRDEHFSRNKHRTWSKFDLRTLWFTGLESICKHIPGLNWIGCLLYSWFRFVYWFVILNLLSFTLYCILCKLFNPYLLYNF